MEDLKELGWQQRGVCQPVGQNEGQGLLKTASWKGAK
jgi:hypothetical protein